MILPKVSTLFFNLRSFFSPTGKKVFPHEGENLEWQSREKARIYNTKMEKTKWTKIFFNYNFLCIFATHK